MRLKQNAKLQRNVSVLKQISHMALIQSADADERAIATIHLARGSTKPYPKSWPVVGNA